MCYITDKDAGVVGKASRGSRRRQTVCRVQSTSCVMPWGLPSARSTLRMDGDEDRACNNAGSRPTSLNDQVLDDRLLSCDPQRAAGMVCQHVSDRQQQP